MITAEFRRYPKRRNLFGGMFKKKFDTMDEVAAFSCSESKIRFVRTSDYKQTRMICQKIAGMVRSRHRLHIPNKDITEIETYLNTLKE